MSNPVAVLISDVHYSLQTLPVADAAMRMAIRIANDHDVPLIVCGDLHDTKANLRGECVNAMMDTFNLCSREPTILVGNHDRINEKSEKHSLEFLRLCSRVVDLPFSETSTGIYLVPYYHDADELQAYLKTIPKGSTVIMHQGLTGSAMGDYIQDKSAIDPRDVTGLRVISGHYHTRQTRELPGEGRWDYVGNPYTLSFGEANDPPKGFQILMSDGSLEFVSTNLRKHVVVERELSNIPSHGIGPLDCRPDDLVWVKIKGPREALSRVSKATVAKYICRESFRLDLIPTDSPIQTTEAQLELSGASLLDSLIEGLSDTTDERKARLKTLWKDLP